MLEHPVILVRTILQIEAGPPLAQRLRDLSAKRSPFSSRYQPAVSAASTMPVRRLVGRRVQRRRAPNPGLFQCGLVSDGKSCVER
jgi:hypothetical protein